MTTWIIIALAVGYCHLLFVLWSTYRVRRKEITDLSEYVEDIRLRTANMDEKLRETKRKAVETMTEYILNIGQKGKITSLSRNKGTT